MTMTIKKKGDDAPIRKDSTVAPMQHSHAISVRLVDQPEAGSSVEEEEEEEEEEEDVEGEEADQADGDSIETRDRSSPDSCLKV
jgi:hypothetical protein